MGSAAAAHVKPGKVSGLGNTASNTNAAPMSDADAEKLYGIKPQKNALGGPFRPGWHLTGELGPELKFENRSGYVANNRAMRQLADYADRVGSVMRPSATRAVQSGAGRIRPMLRQVGLRQPAAKGAERGKSIVPGVVKEALRFVPAQTVGMAKLGRARNSDALTGHAGQLAEAVRSLSADRMEAVFAQPAAAAPSAAPVAGPQTVTNQYTIHAAGADAREVIRLLRDEERRNSGNGLFDRAPTTGPFGR